MTDLRRRQQTAAEHLAHWLTHPLTTHPDEPALIGKAEDFDPDGADTISRWAAALGLPAPTWEPSIDHLGGTYESQGIVSTVTVRVSVFLDQLPGGGQ
ncbi:hypothetical protein ACFYUV_38265 [Nonomuraea sp. NPDC003560]|uniref:hypothetical protein n=1 Tax=Nonomuraea sp. NPDC003560 TaxID=3364341 RepID=UPI0036ACACCB